MRERSGLTRGLPIGGQAFQRKMAAGVGGLKLAFVLFGIFIRLAPTNELQNDVKHEPPENLGY